MPTQPIDRLRADFSNALQSLPRLVVTAPTGSGKSTRLPLWMNEALGGPILIIEPRRVACRSLAEYLTRTVGDTLGGRIGYRVRFEDHSGPTTQCLFVTPGVALRLLGSGDITKQFAGVLVDEFHERGWETDLAVTLLSTLGLPLVLTSATLEGTEIARALGAQHLDAPGRSFPVELRYRAQPDGPTRRDLPQRVYVALDAILDEDDGDVLVFLPGKAELRACVKELEPLRRLWGVDLIEVHGGLPTAQLTRALSASSPTRRVFLSTNVAETSLTLPKVTTVIDSGLARQRLHRAGRSALALVPISRASMDQRAGRAGRLAPGRCVRLWSQRFQPLASTPPEIARVELDDLILSAASCGLSGDALANAPWPTPPPEFALRDAIQRLSKLGVIDRGGYLTPLGERTARLPVGAHEARLLVDPPPALAGWLVDLVASLQRRVDLLLPLFTLPQERRERIQEARAELLRDCDDEIAVQLRCLRHGDIRRHHLHPSQLQEARKVSGSLRRALGLRVTNPTREPLRALDRDALVAFILTRTPSAGFVLRARALGRRKPERASRDRKSESSSEPWSNGDVEVFVYPYRLPHRAPEEQPPSPVAGAILSHAWIGDQTTQVRGVGRMLIPCSLQRMAELELGEVHVEAPEIGKNRRNLKVYGQHARMLAGVVLNKERRLLTDAPLRQAVTTLILAGRLFKGAAAALEDALHLWRVLFEWPESVVYKPLPEPPTDATQYLLEQLDVLGLTESEELSLIGVEDMLPDLSEMTSLSREELDRWSEHFPRLWTLQGSTYRCEVSPLTRRVLITPADRASGKKPPPDAKFLPRFKGFRVDYQKASRRLTLRGR